jgi:general secretion pathway protein K
MDLIPAPKNTKGREPIERDKSGIALFMVIAAISLLSILVTDFTYIAQINQRMAFDSLDQIKAHYLAKSGLKISLLRLKAYQQVKSMLGGGSGDKNNPLAGAIPKGMVEKIWNFPFFFPIPQLPGMTNADKEALDKFHKDSDFDGKFIATIESESSRVNLNSLLPGFVAAMPSPTGSPSPGTSGSPPPTTAASPNPSASPSFSADQARQNLQDYLTQLILNKSEEDEGFAHEYRDYKMDELMKNISAWCDRTYKQDANDYKDILPKGAPFYSLTELHMIPLMDDDLFELFQPNLTASATAGVNVNTIQDATLRALIQGMTVQESKDFFTFRDSVDEDNLFKKEQDFWDYIQAHIGIFRNDKAAVDKYKADLSTKGVHLVTDEQIFKITVQSTTNQATRTIEAWVTLGTTSTNAMLNNPLGSPSSSPSGSPSPSPSPQASNINGNQPAPPPDAGLKITFMRFL